MWKKQSSTSAGQMLQTLAPDGNSYPQSIIIRVCASCHVRLAAPIKTLALTKQTEKALSAMLRMMIMHAYHRLARLGVTQWKMGNSSCWEVVHLSHEVKESYKVLLMETYTMKIVKVACMGVAVGGGDVSV